MNEGDNVIFSRAKNQNASGAESSPDPNDVWDDTLLIQAYDKAVRIAKDGFLEKQMGTGEKGKKAAKKGRDHGRWKVGDKCRCQYSEDMNYYEADIIDIAGATGMCTVKYVGYNNQESMPLKNLKPSQGEEARSQQIEDAANENENSENPEDNPSSWNQGKQSKPMAKKKYYGKDRNGFGAGVPPSFPPLPQSGLHSIVPPPPPPHMFRNLCEDENETEAMSAMLISWYMSGYHTGYYQGLKMAKKQ